MQNCCVQMVVVICISSREEYSLTTYRAHNEVGTKSITEILRTI